MKLWTPPVPQKLVERVGEIDASLARSGVRPEREWLLQLMREHGAALIRLLWRVLGHQQDVLDAYQECLCRLLESGAVGNAGSPPRNYAFQTAMNIAIDMRRRRKVRQDHLGPLAQHRSPAPLASITPRPSYVELMDLLRQAVDSLPDRLREVVTLHDLAEMSYADVAEILGLSVGTVRVYRHDAIERLSELLRQFG